MQLYYDAYTMQPPLPHPSGVGVPPYVIQRSVAALEYSVANRNIPQPTHSVDIIVLARYHHAVISSPQAISLKKACAVRRISPNKSSHGIAA